MLADSLALVEADVLAEVETESKGLLILTQKPDDLPIAIVRLSLLSLILNLWLRLTG